MACMIRPLNRTVKFGAKTQIIEPTKKTLIIIKKFCFKLKESKIHADIGIINPTTNKYDVVSHCAVDWLTSKAVMIVGKALFKKVSANKAVNAPNSKTLIINILFLPLIFSTFTPIISPLSP